MQPGQSSSAISEPPQGAVRATQGFVSTITWTRKHPLLTVYEILWRWAFGLPAIWLLWREGSRILAAAPWQATGVANVSVNLLLTDPEQATATLAAFAGAVTPGVLQTARWLLPMLLLAWIVLSGLGRTLVLARMDRALTRRPLTLIALQAVRLLPLLLTAGIWWNSLQALARHTILDPIGNGGEPEMMVYVGGAIVVTLGLFVLSAATAWIFGVAPIIAMLHNTGVWRSLRTAVRTREMRGSLFEINLVLGIVKIALLVLALVFSACPLPFASVMTGEALLYWNIAVAVWYVLVSDFFHVARLASYLHLWRAPQGGPAPAKIV